MCVKTIFFGGKKRIILLASFGCFIWPLLLALVIVVDNEGHVVIFLYVGTYYLVGDVW